MHLDDARAIKAELRRRAAGIREVQRRPRAAAGGVAVGVCVGPPRTYGVAVRWFGESELGVAVAERGRELAGDECDVRDVGVVRALRWEPADLQRRQRPLRPGLSVAHADVTAGTIGAFVVPAAGGSSTVHILSNNHVLADSDRGAAGDVILQPGPADGGAAPADRVGVLQVVAPLDPDKPNVVDAATAVLDDGIDVEPGHPAGELTGWTEVLDDVAVEKAGRTTGLTKGRVTAIELDDISVEYPVGVIDFEDQIEVAAAGDVPFSAGGDSGSVVYLADTLEAVGLLFAGSERGGSNGLGLTYCNPIAAVLEQLKMRLVPAGDA